MNMQVIGTQAPAPQDDGPSSLAELGEQMRAAQRSSGKAIPSEEITEQDIEASPEDMEADTEDTFGGEPEAEASDDDDVPAPTKRSDSFSRVKASLVQKERENSDLKAQVRAHQAETKRLTDQLRASKTEEPADVMQAMRHVVARHLGLKPNDPRVVEELGRYGEELVLDSLPAGALDQSTDADLKSKRAERQRLKDAEDRHRAVEERFARMERERDDALRSAETQQTHTLVNQRLTQHAAKLPFLSAQNDVDPTQAVVEMAEALLADGHVTLRPGDAKGATALIDRCAMQLDEHYKSLAASLAPRLQHTSKSPQNTQAPRQSPPKQAPRKQSGMGSGTGGGGRGTPGPQRPASEPAEEEDFASFFEAQKRSYAALERKKRTAR